uniref:Uncharacterized protein n=1 Tax=Rhizophora mucronata TaxID=61149 RepID=A0A2P2QFT7_RHIMU
MYLRSLVVWFILAPRDGMRRSLEKKSLWGRTSSMQKRRKKFLAQEYDILEESECLMLLSKFC